jgi:hypothetical protein
MPSYIALARLPLKQKRPIPLPCACIKVLGFGVRPFYTDIIIKARMLLNFAKFMHEPRIDGRASLYPLLPVHLVGRLLGSCYRGYYIIALRFKSYWILLPDTCRRWPSPFLFDGNNRNQYRNAIVYI